MSKTSYFLISVMLTALLYMGAVRGYQLYEKKVAQWEEERQQQASSFSFHNVPVSLAAPQAEIVSAPVVLPADETSMNILPENVSALPMQTEVKKSNSQAILLEDIPLPPEQATRQAKETLRSIVQDFKDEPEIKSFNQDLVQATQGKATDLSALSGGDLRQMLKDNPQIQAVISKHMQDPDFAQKVRQILSNPQFIQSVQQLQKNGGTTAVGKKTN